MAYTKVIRSGDMLEVYEYEKNLPERRKTPRTVVLGERRRKARPRSPDSARRAVRAFRRIVRSNFVPGSNPLLLTVTFFEVVSYETSSVLFRRFAERVRERYGKQVRYIAVPEFQRRGAIHFHVLIWGLPEQMGCTGFYEKRGRKSYFVETCHPDKPCERRTHDMSRLWLRGFCDCRETDGDPRLISYLTKYLSKSVPDVRFSGKKAYHASRNILRPLHVGSGNPLIQGIFANTVIPVDNPLTTFEFDTQWLGRAIYKRYLIK